MALARGSADRHDGNEHSADRGPDPVDRAPGRARFLLGRRRSRTAGPIRLTGHRDALDSCLVGGGHGPRARSGCPGSGTTASTTRALLRAISVGTLARLPPERHAQVTRIGKTRQVRHHRDRNLALSQKVFRPLDSLLHNLPVR